ncbi:hypothetical protein Y032_0280g1223 [Ancylostoma ceylanicum]|uniref:Uncharacterized protein n=1 Tax=Ancylostoma ceylanicum TaxID=53326 RepID=A0A016S7Y0_9BILA|nr:hypothetical protein Y032_0280g1223 [Ancylostoma ceylanicum]
MQWRFFHTPPARLVGFFKERCFSLVVRLLSLLDEALGIFLFVPQIPDLGEMLPKEQQGSGTRIPKERSYSPCA